MDVQTRHHYHRANRAIANGVVSQLMAALHRLYFRAAGMANRLLLAIPFHVRPPPALVSAPTPVVEDHARNVILGGEVDESMEMPMSEPLFKTRIFGLTFVHERSGVISKEPIWICFYGYWMHTGDTLLSLLWNVATEWKNDRRIAG